MSGFIEVKERPEGEVKLSSPASKEAARIENRAITRTGQELVQYIQTLYLSGAKMWTKDMFSDLEAELAKEPMPYSIMIRSMNGVQRRKQIPPKKTHMKLSATKNLCVIPYFKIYQKMIFDAEEESFETDPDEDIDSCDWETYNDDNRTLATRALTLAQTYEDLSSITYTELKAAWDEACQNWNESSVCVELKDILSRSASFPKPITKMVCFGLGSLEGTLEHSTLEAIAKCDSLPRRSAITQHAAALTMAAVIGERLGIGPLPIMAQDPAYSLVAKQLLSEVGIEVVGGRGALAFTHVDDESVVFSVHPNIPVKQVVADISRPAAMIWNRVAPASEEKTQWVAQVMHGEEVLWAPWSTDQDSARTRNLVEGYREYGFPEERERFGDLKIYIRKD